MLTEDRGGDQGECERNVLQSSWLKQAFLSLRICALAACASAEAAWMEREVWNQTRTHTQCRERCVQWQAAG